MSPRKRRSTIGRRLARWCITGTQACGRRLRACWHALLHRVSPTVIVDLPGLRGRRLRRRLGRTARSYARALGTPLPNGLVVVVQRTVQEGGRRHAAMLQAFERQDGARCYVLLLALSPGGSNRTAGDDDIVALLRHGLVEALADRLGRAVLSVSLDVEPERPRTEAPVVELRRPAERSAVPIERIQNEAS